MNKKSIKVVFFGTPEFVTPICQMLYDEYDLVGVVTAADKLVGRKQILTSSEVKRYCEAAKIDNKVTVLTPEKLNSEPFLADFKALKADVAVVAAYGKIIPEVVLSMPKYGFLNVHPSLLPKYRGASPIQSAILDSVEVSGITIIQMDEKMDHGPIVFQENYKLTGQANFQELSIDMFKVASGILDAILMPYITGKLTLTEQEHSLASFCKMIQKQDGYFDIDSPPSPLMLDRMIRAYFPWPTAWTKWNGKVVKFYPNDQIQIEGKNIMSTKDFLNGYPEFPLKSLFMREGNH